MKVDISIVEKNSIRLKGKSISFVVDPSGVMPKTSADAVILLSGIRNMDISRVADSRLVIGGAGEYEVNGAKISGTATPKGILYKLSIDGVAIILGRTTELKAEGFSNCQIAIINADEEFNESFVTALEPKIIVVYGDKKEECAKKLGLENIVSVPKITILKDKLPEKMEVVVLD